MVHAGGNGVGSIGGMLRAPASGPLNPNGAFLVPTLKPALYAQISQALAATPV